MTTTTKKRSSRFSQYRGPGALIVLALVLSLVTILSGCSISSGGISTPTNRYALLIGVQDYETINDLSYPDDDATDMKTTLEAQGWTTATTLINSEATYANIKALIAALSTDPDATILVYYSGHGSVDEATGTTYVLPYDVTLTIDEKWITPATMTDWLAAVPAKNRLLILDSCYSGGFALGDGSVDTSPASYGTYEDGTSDRGLIAAALSKFSSLVSTNLSAYGNSEVLTIAAAGSEEYSYDDDEHENGAFTYYLLQAADNADSDSDGYVTADEAYVYAKNKIKTIWDADYTGNAQNWQWYYNYYGYVPDFLPHISGGTGDIVLYANAD
ncbi:MAG TPA: caspase family protein [Rectinemataceae bacterium]|nr:caspase family protein [Rectinemataceae bacterium]